VTRAITPLLRCVRSVGRPVGSREWRDDMEARAGLALVPGKRGPKPKGSFRGYCTCHRNCNLAAPTGFTRVGFPGQTQTLADLYYNEYRDYDPTTGRYIQADPIGLGGGGNPYAYAGNNPARFTDPLGLAATTLGGFGWGWIGGLGDIALLIEVAPLVPLLLLSSDTPCCEGKWKDVYEGNPKHGPVGRWAGGKWVGPEPSDGALALLNSVPAGVNHRVGHDPINNELVELRVTREDPTTCTRYWHGYVISRQPVPIKQKVSNAARKAGFPIK